MASVALMIVSACSSFVDSSVGEAELSTFEASSVEKKTNFHTEKSPNFDLPGFSSLTEFASTEFADGATTERYPSRFDEILNNSF